jgi:hypothetical protein
VMNNQFAANLISRLPATVKSVLPPDVLASLAYNPQALVSPEAQAQMQGLLAQMGPQGSAIFEQILQALRQALNAALSEVFLIAVFILVVAFIANLFIKEIPLRKQHTAVGLPPNHEVGA